MNEKHMMSYSKLYSRWQAMKRRCYNKKDKAYINYGGRGIEVCKEWRSSFSCFLEWCLKNGYNENLTLDRINVNDNYKPDNCRFVDWTIQNVNQRKRSTNKSGYRNISWDIHTNKWGLRLIHKGKTILRKRSNSISDLIKIRNDFILSNNLPHPIEEYKEKE